MDCCSKADPWKTGSVTVPDLTVAEHLQGWSPAGCTLLSEEHIPGYENRVYQADSGLIYHALMRGDDDVVICWQVDPNKGTVTLIIDNTDTAGYFAFEHVGTILPELFLRHGLCTMHGVLMEHNGKGIILTADSGVGKTTHARLWRDHKSAIILNGDRVTVEKRETHWVGHGLPWSGSSGEQMNRSVEITAVVQIVRGRENRAERLQGMEAFTVALGQLLTPAWDKTLAEQAVDMAAALTAEVPVWRLFCTPDRGAADVLEQTLFGE